MDYTVWQLIIVVIGSAMVILSACCVLFPQQLIDTMQQLVNSRLAKYSDIAIRILLGVSLILSAPTATIPLIFTVFGYLSLLAVIAMLILGTSKLDTIIKYLTSILPLWAVRLVCAFSVLLFSLLIYNIG
ncbi:MAG: hypothetical protein HRU22_11355 [Gammaproteobacteria bacterium]|nr:hypothetical protein [Gammaproteobacteria bacterium]